MKILKYSLIMLLFTIFGCNSDQNNLDISEVEEEEGNTYKTNSVSAYSLEEILNGIRKWDSLRNNMDLVVPFFENYNSLNIDMAQFPPGNALHAYACILNGKLKFAVISEIYDKETYQDSLIDHIKIVDLYHADVSLLIEQTYVSYTFPLPTQYIQATDAINRIEDWNTNYINWLSSNPKVYQGFTIPTFSLAAQNYTVYLGLKNDLENPIVKEADLILDNNLGAFYDAVHSFPRGKTEQYYLIDLI